MLTTLAIAALLGGYAFGMRFVGYVLVPAVLFSLLIVVGTGLALESAVSQAILAAAILTLTWLQVGCFSRPMRAAKFRSFRPSGN